MQRILTFALLIFISTSLKAQQKDFEYPLYPTMDVDFLSLSMNVTLDPAKGTVSGLATYTASANIDGVTRIVLNTAESSIEAVTIDDTELDYEVKSDSLIIQLGDTLNANQEVAFTVTWESNSIYGYHVDANQYMWASALSKSVRHWLPGFDHPRNELKVSATYTVPQGYDVVASGDMTKDLVVLNEDKREITWESTVDMPFTALNWAAGIFEMEEATAGIKKVRFYNQTDSGLETVEVLREAVNLLKQFEQELNYEYPYESLNVIYLDSNYGEENNYGAANVYVYGDGPEIALQLGKGILAQWFGVYKRPVNKDYSDWLLQAAIYKSLNLEVPQYLGKNFGYTGMLVLEYGLDQLFNQTLLSVAPTFLQEPASILTWESLAEKLYEETGQYWNEWPKTLESEPILEQVKSSSVTLPVTYDFDEGANTINLVLQADNSELDTLASARLDIFTFSDTLTREISFTGGLDTVSVKAEGLVDYATLTPLDTNIVFNEVKPLTFLVNQIRSSDAKVREAAALSMAAYANDPDLQLALLDVLNAEQVPEVRAAMLSTYALVTDGAIGTEQFFLEAIRSDAESLKLSGIKALAAYPENDQVVSALGRSLVNAHTEELFMASVSSLLEVADSAALVSNADRLLRADTLENRTFYYLQQVQPIVGSAAVATRAERFLERTFSYEIRKRAIELLGWFAYQEDTWPGRAVDLIHDPDARIRVSVIENSWKLADEEFNTLSDSLKSIEYNAWVIKQLELQAKEREEKKADRL